MACFTCAATAEPHIVAKYMLPSAHVSCSRNTFSCVPELVFALQNIYFCVLGFQVTCAGASLFTQGMCIRNLSHVYAAFAGREIVFSHVAFMFPECSGLEITCSILELPFLLLGLCGARNPKA